MARMGDMSSIQVESENPVVGGGWRRMRVISVVSRVRVKRMVGGVEKNVEEWCL